MVMTVWEFIPGILLSGRYPIITRQFGKLLMVRNAVTCMVIALAALLCVSCSAGGDIRVVSIEQVSPGEANIVVRISMETRQIRRVIACVKVISPSCMMMGLELSALQVPWRGHLFSGRLVASHTGPRPMSTSRQMRGQRVSRVKHRNHTSCSAMSFRTKMWGRSLSFKDNKPSTY